MILTYILSLQYLLLTFEIKAFLLTIILCKLFVDFIYFYLSEKLDSYKELFYTFTLFFALYYCSNFVIKRFSIFPKWECWSPVSCTSSSGHAGFMLHYFLAAEAIEHAIRYWFVLTSLWSYKLKSMKNSIYFSTRFTHLSS